MRYLKNVPFEGHDGPVLTTEGKPAYLFRLLTAICRSYVPQQGKMLDTGGMRDLWHCIDALEDTSEDEWCAFDKDGDYAVLSKVVSWIAPIADNRATLMNCDLLEKAVQDAPTERPKDEVEPESSPDEHKAEEAIPAGVE